MFVLPRDKVPIMMHDANINIRLTEKSPISGDFDQFAFNFLEQYITLDRRATNSLHLNIVLRNLLIPLP